MRGHHPVGEWKEVRREKRPHTTKPKPKLNYNIEDLTNFYVVGFPGDAIRDDLRKSFTHHGEVVDVYMGGKRDVTGKFFTFVRFLKVADEKALEVSLQGIKFREHVLSVNLAKHLRKEVNQTKTFRRPPAPSFNHPHTSGIRDTRSFAQVISGSKYATPTNPPSPLIPLRADTFMGNWVKDKILIGEVHSPEHIEVLPDYIFKNEGTKFLGGLNIAIGFDHSAKATEFREDKERWKGWFKWMNIGHDCTPQQERLVWLRIIGVPLKLWDTDNFSRIASRFGEVFSPFGNIITRRDMSYGRVGIITKEVKWINEEVIVEANGETFRVGVCEHLEEWNPFKSMDDEETMSEEEEDDDKAVGFFLLLTY